METNILENLSKDELMVNLAFKTLRSSDIEDNLEEGYDRFSCEELSREDVYFLLDKLSTSLPYSKEYLRLYSSSAETLYLIRKRKELAEDFLNDEYGITEITNYANGLIGEVIEIFFDYDFSEDRLTEFMFKVFEKAKKESYPYDFEYFKRIVKKTHSNVQEVENFLTKIKTLYTLG